jgi:hypothetical protein
MILHVLMFVLMCVPTAVEAYVDVRDFREGKRDKKKGRDVVFRILGMIFVGIIQSRFTDYSWWQVAILSGGIFILLFDMVVGYGMTKRLFFLGKTSQTDRWLNFMPWFMILFFRGIIFVACATVYYDLDKVLYGNF